MPWPACGKIRQNWSDLTCVEEFNHEYKPMNYLYRCWHLYWLTLDWLWAFKTTTLGLTFFLFSICLWHLIFSLGDSVKGGKKVSLDRRRNDLKAAAAEQLHSGNSALLVRLISAKQSKRQNNTYNTGVCIAVFTKSVLWRKKKKTRLKETRIKWERSLKPTAFLGQAETRRHRSAVFQSKEAVSQLQMDLN